MGRPRGSGKKKPSYWKWLRSHWRRIGLAAFLLFFFGAGFYLAQLYGEISQLIEERSAGLTSAIYSAPMVISQGDDLARMHILDRLRSLSYSEMPKVARPGQYQQQPGAMTIYSRKFSIGAQQMSATLVRISLSGSKVTGVHDYFGMPLEHATLEPEVIGRLYPNAPAERVEVQLADLKPYLVRGLTDTEDRYFYWHPGFDPIRIVEAALKDWHSHRLAQGASTITQQLARTFTGERTRTFRRKFKELAVALVIELKLSKNDILERYVNDVPMGEYDGTPIYGMPLAARYFFNKDLGEVTPDQAAILIGMIQAPTMYDPRRHPEACRARRDVVLGVMRRAGLIDETSYTQALAAPIAIAQLPGLRRAPYFTDYVTSLVPRMPGFTGSLRGLRVYTTLDPEMQAEAQNAVTGNLEHLEKIHSRLRRRIPKNRLESSMVVLDAHTGGIRTMVGGRDYQASQFNRAAQAERQVGSAFKPIVYLIALDPSRSPLAQDVTLASLLPDRPMSFGGWAPVNYEHTYQGTVTVAEALAESLNVPTAYLGSLLGAPRMVRTAHEMGIPEHMPAVLPIAIGAGETTLLNLTSVYQVFASGGMADPPYAIESIIDGAGRVIYQHTPAAHRLIAADVAYVMTGALEGVMRYGTGVGATRLGVDFPAAGKTGTTEDYRDAYFVGYTPNLVCGVWVGFDQPQSLGIPGADAALPAWARLMSAESSRAADFKIPPGITFATIDPATGGLATPACPKTARLPFLYDTQPTAYCALHSGGGMAGPITAGAAGTTNSGTNANAAGVANPPGSPMAAPTPEHGLFSGVAHLFGFGH
ncbi:MAG: transglycosylase domain-containing protein [Candidatus Binataceae bacterium]|nr:transglycosylase domain-containing protein [Candidatus Binataceae bacterium]